MSTVCTSGDSPRQPTPLIALSLVSSYSSASIVKERGAQLRTTSRPGQGHSKCTELLGGGGGNPGTSGRNPRPEADEPQPATGRLKANDPTHRSNRPIQLRRVDWVRLGRGYRLIRNTRQGIGCRGKGLATPSPRGVSPSVAKSMAIRTRGPSASSTTRGSAGTRPGEKGTAFDDGAPGARRQSLAKWPRLPKF